MHVNHLGVFSWKCVGSVCHMTVWQFGHFEDISKRSCRRCRAITSTRLSIFRLTVDQCGFFNSCLPVSVCSLHWKVWVAQLTHQHRPSHSDYEITYMSYSQEVNLSECVRLCMTNMTGMRVYLFHSVCLIHFLSHFFYFKSILLEWLFALHEILPTHQ